MPRVVILGFPNVGKSTLFNRLLGQRKALVHSLPGMTRDLITGIATVEGKEYLLIDTGGFADEQADPLLAKVREKAWEAAQKGDILIFLIDGKRSLTPGEEKLFIELKKLNKHLLVVVNKVDNPELEPDLSDYYRLGSDELILISAEHKINLGYLQGKIAELLPQAPGELKDEERTVKIEPAERPLKIAIVGRVNVGKSSLVNRLCGEERLLVSEVPGTTRDSIDTLINRSQKTYCLIDTAGIRKFSGTKDSREKASIIRAEKNIEEADVICLVMDVQEFPTRQDAHIASLAFKSGKPMIIALNKWDLVDKSKVNPDEVIRHAFNRLHFVDYAPVIFVSAKTGQRVVKILDLAEEVYKSASKKIETSTLNSFWEKFSREYPPKTKDGSFLKVKYILQRGVRPPSFILFGHGRGPLLPAYEKYLSDVFRRQFGFSGTPIRFSLRKS
ncbi:MAG TPA: ribosome biogenesis GTPase Der [Candidatus Aminicenantes bacterium]|nr:MAG: ribosome biogenesis GTPase Der [Candidatus Aminicenantes bacterium]HEK86264.1 ribosome biogenesis GTPase Der [Candidatus Aminicenantes bacterium]